MTTNPTIDVVVSKADQLGETPLWCDRTDKLWWVDIEQPKLQSYDFSTGKHNILPLPGTFAGTHAFSADGRQLLAEDLELYLLAPESGERVTVAGVEPGFDNRLNDGRVDAHGRFWVGTMDNQLYRPNGGLYRIDHDGTATRMADDVTVANGITFSPDGRTLYFTDTRRYTSYAYNLDPQDGTITNRRIFADYSATRDRPDGACIDVDGCIWAAFFGGKKIVRYTPGGVIDCTIELPVTNPTCVCFGGDDYKTLFITSATKFLTPEQRSSEPLAGAVLAISGLGQGLPENRFEYRR